tara:strand:- start:48 stop:2564 length:2517 start_codon:yes stop_codon:yes gene_type:complete
MVSPTATGYQFSNNSEWASSNTTAGTESLLRQIKRVQSINYSWNVGRTDVNQLGNLARIDSAILTAPTVSLDFTYLLTDGKNEHLLGFDNTEGSSFLSQDFISDKDGRNFYILTAKEGLDAAPGTIAKVEAQSDSDKSVIALGNCYITNYSLNAAVGGMPTVNVSAEAFNIRSTHGTSGTSPGISLAEGKESPAITYKISSEYVTSGSGTASLRPGDVDVSVGGSGLLSLLGDSEGKTRSHVQSCTIDVPLGRTTLQRIGNQFGFSKTLNTPLSISVGISAILADQVATSSRSLFEDLYNNNKTDLTITFKKPSSAGAGKGEKAVIFTVKNATLESESYGMAIGDNRSVDYNFTATIGSPDTASVTTSSILQMNASGSYEKLQLFATGTPTDDNAIGTMTATSNDGPGYGTAVAASDKYLVIGASGFQIEGSSAQGGCAYIYKNEKGFYTQVAQTSGGKGTNNTMLAVGGGALTTVTNHGLLPSSTEDANFGTTATVSDNNMIAIGMPNSAEDGIVEILEPHPEDDNVFRVNSILKYADGTDSIKYGEDAAWDKKGISASGTNLLAVGVAHHTVGSTGQIGSVALYSLKKGEVNSAVGIGTTPILTFTEVTGDPHTEGEMLGESVAMHNNIVVGGAPRNKCLDTDDEVSGAAFVWYSVATDRTTKNNWHLSNVLTGTDWGTTAGRHQNSAFGYAVDIYDKVIAVGAPSGEYNGNSNCGAVYVFTGLNDDVITQGHTDWDHVKTLVASDSNANKRFGSSVSMPNAHTIIVGAQGGGGVYEGSFYVFTGYEGNWTQTFQVQPTGTSEADGYGFPEAALDTSEKEVFIGGFNPEEVIRYRI